MPVKKKDALKKFFDSCPTHANFDLTSDIAFTKKPKAMQKLYKNIMGMNPSLPCTVPWLFNGP